MKNADARAARSRRALLDASLELMLHKPNASLSEVAEHAGIGRATLYRHFDTREALLRALVKECLEVTDAAVNPIYEMNLTARQTIEEMLKAIVPLADKFHFLLSLWSVSNDDAEINAIYNQQLNALYELIEAAKGEGAIRQHLNSGWLVCLIDSFLYSAWWMLGKKYMSEQDAIDQILETLFTGIEA